MVGGVKRGAEITYIPGSRHERSTGSMGPCPTSCIVNSSLFLKYQYAQHSKKASSSYREGAPIFNALL